MWPQLIELNLGFGTGKIVAGSPWSCNTSSRNNWDNKRASIIICQCNRHGLVLVILITIMWYYNQNRKHSMWISRNKDMTRIQAIWKSSIALLYNRTCTEGRQGNPPTPYNHCFIYNLSTTLELSPMYQCTIGIFFHDLWHHPHHLISTTTPHSPMSQHHRPLPDLTE